MSANLYRCDPRQMRRHVLRCIKAGVVPMVRSSPGIGKSSIIKSIAKEYNLHLIDHRLSTSTPEDLTGLPRFVDDRAEFVPFKGLFPIESDAIPLNENGQPYDGWILFLDEFNHASKAVQSACYKLILDRMIGQYKLHPNVVIVCAGNLDSDRAFVNAQSTAMQSRMAHLEMEVSFPIWFDDVAMKESYDSRLTAFLSWKPRYLMDFRPDHLEQTFCAPRTWEFVNRLIKNEEIDDEFAQLLAGVITSGVAVEFVQFTKIFNNVVKLEDILKNPNSCPVPEDIGLSWATVSMMIDATTAANFDALGDYAERMDMGFRILYFRGAVSHNKDLLRHPAVSKALSLLARHLHDD